jgi:hypothetical protein
LKADLRLNFTNHGSKEYCSFVNLDEAFMEDIVVIPEFIQSLSNEIVSLATMETKMGFDHFLGGLMS